MIKNKDIDFYLRKIEDSITQLRMLTMEMHVIGRQLATINVNSGETEDLKRRLDDKYERANELLGEIFREDEKAEHIIQKLRELI